MFDTFVISDEEHKMSTAVARAIIGAVQANTSAEMDAAQFNRVLVSAFAAVIRFVDQDRGALLASISQTVRIAGENAKHTH